MPVASGATGAGGLGKTVQPPWRATRDGGGESTEIRRRLGAGDPPGTRTPWSRLHRRNTQTVHGVLRRRRWV